MGQLTLSFEADLTERYGDLRECMAARIYKRGLKRVAMDLDKSPGNLSRELGGDSDRHFSVEAFERYLQTSGDLEPVYYLIARYMGNQAEAEAATIRRLEDLLGEVRAVVGQVQNKKPSRR